MYFADDPISAITEYGDDLSHLHTIDVLHGNCYPTDPENPHQKELIKAYAEAVPNGRISIEGAPFTTVETAVQARKALEAYIEYAGGGKKIWIGNDHGGTVLKNQIVAWLQDRGYTVVNVGTDGTDIVRYPYYAAKVCRAVQEGKAWRGILICSTGIGMSIAANKYKGIRASLCTDTYMGRLTRAHNDSNVLCLGGRITGDFEAFDILDVWLKTAYEGGRHAISLGLIADAEEEMITGEPWKGEDA
ncbi:MAG: ribose 5-phosphate isomerase B [Lachnospiraceae bacterium]|nr:ribose 5-phosphate isomerase B [Lachnospiraceae bacterium]